MHWVKRLHSAGEGSFSLKWDCIRSLWTVRAFPTVPTCTQTKAIFCCGHNQQHTDCKHLKESIRFQVFAILEHFHHFCWHQKAPSDNEVKPSHSTRNFIYCDLCQFVLFCDCSCLVYIQTNKTAQSHRLDWIFFTFFSSKTSGCFEEDKFLFTVFPHVTNRGRVGELQTLARLFWGNS